MKFLTGLAIGGAIGYVLGAKAGREQYNRIVATVDGLLNDDTKASLKQTLGATMDAAGKALRDAAAD